MPRRAPPTPLRLFQGPLPGRSRPKHTLPSLPRPTFYPRPPAPRASPPRARTRAQSIDELLSPVRPGSASMDDLQAHIVVQMPSVWGLGQTSESGSSSPVSVYERASEGGYSRPASPGSEDEPSVTMRGPWDHSGSIKIPFDVEAILAPLRPAVLNAGLVR